MKTGRTPTSDHLAAAADVAVGLDVGSTTVKTVVVDRTSRSVLWADYRRHETCQAAKACEMLEGVLARFGDGLGRYRLFLTGSGGPALSHALGGRYVQEVSAVAVATERCHPEANAVVELGGQDAKMIVWTVDRATGIRRRFSSMNDRCAGGTGAVLDKIRGKLGVDDEALRRVRYDPARLHPVAAKCGVFAETDIVGLQKQGVSPDELLASLCDAIVQQNLRVLARGQVLRPVVLLLGGPNHFVPALQAAWRENLLAHWRERGVELAAEATPGRLVILPERALYFPALGAVLHGLEEEASVEFRGPLPLRRAIVQGTTARMEEAAHALVQSAGEAEMFLRRYAPPAFPPPPMRRGGAVAAFLGIDAGSTSTKGVLLDPAGRLLAKAYRLSVGNPVEDTQLIVQELGAAAQAAGATLRVAGVGVTGYAKDLIRDVIGADVVVVETVAHAQAAVRLWPEVDVVCDVGGQDIKILFLRQGRIWDFRLNTQCSAGNGYYLQATAGRFGLAVEEFAAAAFTARRAPTFHFGCAVFLETDIVNAQQLGWTPEEILAGLAQVLPKNIWLYVVQEPNLAKYGRRFLLQGGTQRNAAALKAQVDFIRARVPDAEIRVHDHPGECGAIGAGLEAMRGVDGRSRFIGFDAVAGLRVEVRRDESTRCHYCKNACVRTFVRAFAPDGSDRRLIIATCERGAEDDADRVREAHRRMKARLERAPNLVGVAADRAFRSFAPAPAPRASRWTAGLGRVGAGVRGRLRIGIPRALNFYSVAPFFTAYLESLGVPFGNLVFSDITSEPLVREGSRRGAVDPCFPAKAALAHVYQLASSRTVTVIFFPRLATLPTFLRGARDSMACPTVAATPDVIRAALTREPDVLAARGVELLTPTLHMAEGELFSEQLFGAWRHHLGLSRAEHGHAMGEGWRALERFVAELRAEGDRVLSRLEAEGGLAVVVLARPYHNDPGINHLIFEEIQRLGYPVLPIEALPVDEERIEHLFARSTAESSGAAALSVSDVWANAYSENSVRKLWGAKYAARHPNLVAVDLSSFKCGHDAPLYDVIPRILESTGTAYFALHDLDENRPASSIRIRIETLAYFLHRYGERRDHRRAQGRAEPLAVHV